MGLEVVAAQALGARAILAFMVALAALLLLVFALLLTLKRFEDGPGRSALTPQRLLLVRMIFGVATVIGAVIVFAVMTEALDMREAMSRFDMALTEALWRQPSAARHGVFSLITLLGDSATLTLLCIAVAVALWWRRQRTLAVGWVVAIAGNGMLNNLLKISFERARPLHDPGLVTAAGWSFPSGHSSGSVVAYGMLAYLALRLVSVPWHLPVLLMASAVAFTTGFSRVFLHVHYASDVVAGFASGLSWLTVCVLSLEWLRLRQATRPWSP